MLRRRARSEPAGGVGGLAPGGLARELERPRIDYRREPQFKDVVAPGIGEPGARLRGEREAAAEGGKPVAELQLQAPGPEVFVASGVVRGKAVERGAGQERVHAARGRPAHRLRQRQRAPGAGCGVAGELATFAETLDELLASRHKVLVFSQFVKHLKLIEEYLAGAGIAFQYFDGSTPARARAERIAAFQAGQGDLTRELQMRINPRERRTTAKRAALWCFREIETLRRTLIQRAGRIIRPAGTLILLMNTNARLEGELRHALATLNSSSTVRKLNLL